MKGPIIKQGIAASFGSPIVQAASELIPNKGIPVPKEVPTPDDDGSGGGLFLDPAKDPNSPLYQSGITYYRPEIISLTKFSPLYDENKSLTKSGMMFEALIESLRKNEVNSRNILNSSQEQKEIVLKSNDNLKKELIDLNNKLDQLGSFIKFFSSLKGSIDINNFKLDAQSILSSDFSNSTFTTYDSLINYSTAIEKNLSIKKVLHNCLRYKDRDKDLLDNFFDHDATRCWVIALAEMKTMIQSHSRNNMKIKIEEQEKSKSGDSYPYILVSDRITTPELVNIGFGRLDRDAGGANRFLKIDTDFSSYFKDELSLMSVLLYSTFKEVRQRACLNLQEKDSTITRRNTKLDSMILGGYEKTSVYTRIDNFSAGKLYDVGIHGDISNRQKPIFVFEKTLPSYATSNSFVANDYFFKDFGSESFFAEVLSSEGQNDFSKVEDYVSSLNIACNSFKDFISNSGVLPVDDSKVTFPFSLDPVTFFRDLCSKFVDHNNNFTITKDYIKKAGYIASADSNIDALMFFGIAHPTSRMIVDRSSKDIDLKGLYKDRYRTDRVRRTPEENSSNMKNALYSYILARINEEEISTGLDSDSSMPIREIYGVLTNIADVVGGGLRTNDDMNNSPLDENVKDYFKGTNKYLDSGETASVILAHDPAGDYSTDESQINFLGPTTTGNPQPVAIGESDVEDAIKYGIFSIQSAVNDGPWADHEPKAHADIKLTLENSSLVDTVIEIMRPIVQSRESEEFSLIVFDVICRMISRLSPLKKIRVYIDDIVNDEASSTIDNAGTSTDADTEIKSGLVFFTHLYTLNDFITKTEPLLNRIKIIENMVSETSFLISLMLCTYNVSKSLLNIFTSVKNKLTTFKSDIAQYIISYLDGDTKKFGLLFNEQQLSLTLSSFKDVYDSFNTFTSTNSNPNESPTDQLFNSYLDGLCYSPKVVSVLRSFFKDEEFTFVKGYNKQILTVGLPLGLLEELNNKFKTKANSLGKLSQQKSNDIFKILIYKIDLLNDDIVYVPKEFLFETSRFPVRTYSKISDVSSLELNSNFQTTLFKIFPTRDFEIYSEKSGNKIFIEVKPTSDINEAFSSADYSQFLTKNQKENILQNHITSFILENYLQIISGIQFNESPFILSSIEQVEQLYKDLYTTPVQNQNIPTALKNPSLFLKKILYPKKFDRVFNIPLDPEFIVDVQKSNNKKIQKMLSSGKLKRLNSLQIIDQDKSFIDPALNAYFVNIETLTIT